MSKPLIISVEAVEVGVWFDRLLVLLVLALMAAAWWLETPYNLVWVGVFAALAWGLPRWLHGPRRAAEAARLRHEAMRAVDTTRRHPNGYNAASLCAQARSPVLHKPWALRFDTDGQLGCRWTAEAPWVRVSVAQSLRLGPLVHLRFMAPGVEASVPPAAGGRGAREASEGGLRARHTMADGTVAAEEASGAASASAPCPAKLAPDNQNIPPACGVESGRIDPIPYAAPTSTESTAAALMTTASPKQRAGEAPWRHASCLLWMPRLPAGEAAALQRWLLWRQRSGH